MENRVKPGFRRIALFFNAIAFYTSGQLAWMYYGYFDLMKEYFGVSGTEMGYLGLVTGLVMIVCWPLGGMIADKLSIRTAFVSMMGATTAIYVINSFVTNYYVYLGIVFVSCLVVGGLYGLAAKVVKRIYTPETENTGVGFLWAVYAIIGTALGFSGAYLVELYGLAGWSPLMFLFAGASAVAAIGGFFLLKEENLNPVVVDESAEKSAFKFADVKKVLLMPELWVAGLIYHTMLMMTCAGISAISMLGDIYMVPLAVITAIGTVRAYLARVFLAPTSGAIVAKTKDSMGMIRYLCIAAIAGIVLFFLFPMTSDYMYIAIILVVVMTIGFGMQAPLWMTPINDMRIAPAYQGTAVGVYNAIGCISDAYIYILTGWFVDTYGVYQGNQMTFGFIGVMLAICIVLTIVCGKMIKKRNAKLDAGELTI